MNDPYRDGLCSIPPIYGQIGDGSDGIALPTSLYFPSSKFYGTDGEGNHRWAAGLPQRSLS